MASKIQHIAITGVTRGLGLALAEVFIEGGLTVSGCGRSRRTIADLKGRFGAPHGFSVVDVASPDEVSAWSGEVVAATGVPDLLINNAGLINETASLWEVPDEEFSRIVDVNVKGVYRVIRAFLPRMIERGSGIVVNLSSGWGRSTSPGVAPYCATKWAIEGMTRALAQELPRGLAAVALNPGVIDTDMLRTCFGASAESYPTPAEWAPRAARLLLGLSPSDNGKAMTVG